MLLRIIPFEIHKMLEQPMVLLFFIASLLLNTIYITTAGLDQSYLDYIQETEEKPSHLVTPVFREKLSKLPSSREQQRLMTETAGLGNIFENFSTENLGQEMIDFFQIKGSTTGKIKKKYKELAPVVHELAEKDTALELGSAEETAHFFTFIRNKLFYAILGESLVFALLIGLYGSTSEKLTKTDVSVLTTKTGRKIQGSKYVASLLITLLFYGLITILTFTAFNYMHPLGTLWQTSVSTQFHLNVYVPQILEIPFITWQPMTLMSYTILSILLGGLLIIFCHGFNFLVGLWTDHLFRGLVVFVIVYVVLLGLEQISDQLGWWNMHSLLMWHPISLWKLQSFWFTEMGPYTTIPWQETIAAVVNVLFLSLGGALTSKFYVTKEVK